jgi:BREX protein BrxB
MYGWSRLVTLPLFEQSPLREAFAALRRDLISADGPSISTMRNYRFAILQYEPSDEFKLRGEVQRLTSDLSANGWMVISISLQKLLLDRVRAQGSEWVDRVVQMERRMADIEPARGLNYLKSKLSPLVEGPDGIAADCGRVICEYVDNNPSTVDRTVVLIGRAGALYPFIRTSALLRHLDGRTRNVPVVLLYPGARRGPAGLSFMGVLNPDNDYRPRIYP